MGKLDLLKKLINQVFITYNYATTSLITFSLFSFLYISIVTIPYKQDRKASHINAKIIKSNGCHQQ